MSEVLMQIKKETEFLGYAACMQSLEPVSCPLTPALTAAESRTPSPTLDLVRNLIILTKPRLAFFSLLSAAIAYVVTVESFVWMPFMGAMVAIALAAGGALSLNHWWERRTDALMRRTQHRPLPSGHLNPWIALGWSVTLSFSGVITLFLGFGATSALLACGTIGIYGVIYTPLKRKTRWATEVGAISGALPPLIGSAAAGQWSSPPALVLFGIILFWQMPHFYAIAWMHRADYRRAGFPLLPAVDPDGRKTARWSLGYSILLTATPMVACFLGWSGWIFAVVAGVGSLAMVYQSARLYLDSDPEKKVARRLFLTTLVYLPPVMMALWLERLLRAL